MEATKGHKATKTRRGDLDGVARLLLVVVFVHGRLQEERVLALGTAHLLHAELGRLHHDARVALHVLRHTLVDQHLRALQSVQQTFQRSTRLAD